MLSEQVYRSRGATVFWPSSPSWKFSSNFFSRCFRFRTAPYSPNVSSSGAGSVSTSVCALLCFSSNSVKDCVLSVSFCRFFWSFWYVSHIRRSSSGLFSIALIKAWYGSSMLWITVSTASLSTLKGSCANISAPWPEYCTARSDFFMSEGLWSVPVLSYNHFVLLSSNASIEGIWFTLSVVVVLNALLWEPVIFPYNGCFFTFSFIRSTTLTDISTELLHKISCRWSIEWYISHVSG